MFFPSQLEQLKQELLSFRLELQEEKRKGGELQSSMLKQEREAREEIHHLKVQVESMGTSLKTAEDDIQTNEQLLMTIQNESSAQKQQPQEEITDLKVQMERMGGTENNIRDDQDQRGAARNQSSGEH